MNPLAARVLFILVVGSLFAAGTGIAVGPLQFYSITPCRIYDTRTLNPPAPLINGVNRNIRVRGLCGIPAGSPLPQAVALNATIVQPTAAGWLAVWQYAPGSNPPPGVSNINFNAGEPALANGAIVALHPSDATLHISAFVSGANAHLVLDAVGYYQ
jgi:hypothetical protein